MAHVRGNVILITLSWERDYKRVPVAAAFETIDFSFFEIAN